MPRLNQSGPEGKGAMTGNQRGMCRRTDDQFSGQMGSGRGRGMGMRQGEGPLSGQGRRAATRGEVLPTQKNNDENELEKLKEQYQETEKLLSTIKERIRALGQGQ